MPKFQLLLLDAGIVIELFRLDLWERVIEKYEITLSEIVAKEEVKFWEEDDGSLHSIDLDPFIQSGQVQCIAVPLQQIGHQQGELEWKYTKAFREKYSQDGQQDHLMGRGLKDSSDL